MRFILNTFWNTVKISQKNIAEGALIAAISVSDNEKLDVLSGITDPEYTFENMSIKKYENEVIINPDFHRGMNPKEISEYVQIHPEIIKKPKGWGEIKVKHSEHQYIISFEYRVDDTDKMISMIQHPEVYCYNIIQKFRNK